MPKAEEAISCRGAETKKEELLSNCITKDVIGGQIDSTHTID